MLELAWDNETLLLWGTAAEASPLDGPSLAAVAQQRLGALVAQQAVTTAAGRAALALTHESASALLKSPSPQDGPSIRWFVLLEQFVIERLRAGQFYPAAEALPGGVRGAWRPVVSSAAEVEWLRGMAVRLPEVLRQPGATRQEELSQELVESYIVRRMDAHVRALLSRDAFFESTADRCRVDDATDDMRWLASLVGRDTTLNLASPETLGVIRPWVGILDAGQPERSFRVVFELSPPEEEAQPWEVALLLEEGEETIEAHTLWQAGEHLPAVLGRALSTRRERLLEEVERARQIWPSLNRIDAAAPAELELTAADALALMRQWAPLLQDAGFGVRLPEWARTRPRQMTIELAVQPADSLGLGTAGGESAFAGTAGLDGSSGRMGLSALLDFNWELAIGDLRLTEEQFTEILSRQQPLVKVGGEWVEVDVEAARRAMDFIQRQGKGKMTLADALRTAHSVTREETGLEVSGLVGASWIEGLLKCAPDAALVGVQQPASFQGSLRPYQLRGLEWLVFLQRLGIGACLADDMGLGKTIQLISLLLLEREEARRQGAEIAPTLIFAPTSVLSNWLRELERFAPELRAMVHHGPMRLHASAFAEAAGRHDVVITSYALAARDVEDLRRVAWHRLALDEAQKIKNPSATSTLAVRSIPAAHRVALTGTPIENHLLELWSIMEVLNPGLLGTSAEFRERFALPIERQGDSSRGQHLRAFIRPFVLRRTKSDPAIAGDLPEKMEMPVYCNLTVEQASLYQRITDEMLGQIDSATGIRRRGLILAALTRLKQVCDHPRLLAGKIRGVSDSEELSGRSGKCERLAEMLEEVIEVGECALVFTQFKEMGDLIEQLLARRLEARVLYLHGGTPAAKRDELVREFQDPHSKARVFILSLRAGGLGLNLTRANHVFHFDRWWNPAVEQQATDRAHRIGQTRRVEVHKYICIGTMEERIDKLLQEKVDLADRIVTSGDDWLTGLSTDELRKTLQLSSEAVEDYSSGGGA
jgi:hypothetical protein